MSMAMSIDMSDFRTTKLHVGQDYQYHQVHFQWKRTGNGLEDIPEANQFAKMSTLRWTLLAAYG